MRVLVATDGSKPSQIAMELVASLKSGADTTVRVLEILPPLPPALLGEATLESLKSIEREDLKELAAPLRRTGVAGDEVVLRGDSVADLIVRDAAAWQADLIVTGSRGRGPITSMLLGSVAAAVSDHAPCPVLVARRPTCTRIVLAEDGSEGSFEARRLLSRWEVFKGLPVTVVSVAQLPRTLRSGVAPTMLDEARAAEAEMAAEVRAAHEGLARAAAEDLRVAGLKAQADLREGDPAAEIIAAAQRANADLIVIGSRGRSGITRALLGSVARNVLLHADCSVLIVRRVGNRA